MILLILCIILYRVVQQLFLVRETLFLCGGNFQCTKHKSGSQSLHGNSLFHLLQKVHETQCKDCFSFLRVPSMQNRIQQTQNRKTLRTLENRNINPKTEINIPKRKHIQNKNTKLNHKTEREFKNTNHDQKPQNRDKEIM